MTFKHNFMLDIETLGTDNNGAVVAIGACWFDPYSFEPINHTFHVTIDPDSALRYGLTVTGSTIKWWMQQSDAARANTFGDAHPLSLPIALDHFNRYIDGISRGQPREVAVWGNGATFDNVLLRSAYKAVGLQPAWGFRGDKCYRTIINLLREEARPGFKRHGTHHNALDDAITQARYLQECTKLLGLHADTIDGATLEGRPGAL